MEFTMIQIVGAVYGPEKMSRNFGRAHSPPCITARRGGRAINKMSRSVRKMSRSVRGREAGVVFRLRTKRKTTPAASVSVASQNLLMTQPPLLAVMQGGECAAPTHFDI